MVLGAAALGAIMPMHCYCCPRGHEFERFENINDIADKRCPTCRKMAKITPSLTGAPILRQGVGGFYKPSKGDAQ